MHVAPRRAEARLKNSDQYSLPKQSGYANKLFGEHKAILMAKTWAAKMPHFLTVFLAQESVTPNNPESYL